MTTLEAKVEELTQVMNRIQFCVTEVAKNSRNRDCEPPLEWTSDMIIKMFELYHLADRTYLNQSINSIETAQQLLCDITYLIQPPLPSPSPPTPPPLQLEWIEDEKEEKTEKKKKKKKKKKKNKN